jgi:DNA-binding NarL/FixJ family response regulator
LWFPADVAGGAAAEAELAAGRLASLTAQQMRVLQMIVEGKLNKQIAGDLDIAEQTVKGHVSAILRKLRVHSRTQIVLAVGSLLNRAKDAERD